MSANTLLPGLSVVIPVHNEQNWIDRSVGALVASAEAAAWPVEIIVVDDGSTDATGEKLAALQRLYGITVLTQPNSGRFEARRLGITKAAGEQVLLLDSRVIIDPESLTFLREQLIGHPERQVWNGHINVASEQNPYAGFMAGLVKIPWRRYCANPRLMSFGIEEFDVFPKGTGFFSAPRQVLEDASNAFVSLFDDARFASDDTGVLRWIAERQRIHLAPELSATYHGRESLKKFVAQSYFRGTTFVDSYLASPGPARNGFFAAFGVGLLGLGVAAKRPKTAVTLGVLGSAAAGAAVTRFGATKAEARAVAQLSPLFAAGFGAGAVRGLYFALRARRRR
ncbi:glycosyltransferase family 2 protein [Amycolatopsis sp. H20-H5]|uniref:glycosyltransferase family 2 protein n=1 Tax=Amycolatopsis sp. H20-H5 TaxID=3046309 RepID=UPI002DBB592B|nr:glycosyltransferase family 2 protein [Amycolatopsis sp. H20-H5]MEC3975140.1 glycosyltransferase family 2 protein [Amycolatopsis sp. H20-H5]